MVRWLTNMMTSEKINVILQMWQPNVTMYPEQRKLLFHPQTLPTRMGQFEDVHDHASSFRTQIFRFIHNVKRTLSMTLSDILKDSLKDSLIYSLVFSLWKSSRLEYVGVYSLKLLTHSYTFEGLSEELLVRHPPTWWTKKSKVNIKKNSSAKSPHKVHWYHIWI